MFFNKTFQNNLCTKYLQTIFKYTFIEVKLCLMYYCAFYGNSFHELFVKLFRHCFIQIYATILQGYMLFTVKYGNEYMSNIIVPFSMLLSTAA